jgi:pimeloyl-ACP methyl ester carboxylesterase
LDSGWNQKELLDMNVQRFSRREFLQLAGQATVGVVTATLLAGCIAPVAAQEAEINGAQLDIRVRGRGTEPIVFVHGSMGDETAAVVVEPALINDYRVIDYHRRGWGRSELPEAPVSIVQQAADLRAVMDHVGVARAHLVGQSYGGIILMQMALDYPDAVQSLSLLEPAVPSIIFASPEFQAVGAEAGALYGAGDNAGAMAVFGNAVCGEDFRTTLGQTLAPGYFERWAAAADTFFLSEAPAMDTWQFSREDAARITQPVLNMRGAQTRDYFRDVYETLEEWLPQAENVILPDATHCMLQSNPAGAAEQIAGFIARHRMLVN